MANPGLEIGFGERRRNRPNLGLACSKFGERNLGSAGSKFGEKTQVRGKAWGKCLFGYRDLL